MQDSLSYFQYHRQLLQALYELVVNTAPFDSANGSEDDQQFIAHLKTLCQNDEGAENFLHDGQWLISTIIARYPHITPQVSRDLFWFFGGDCLHYMSDDEISFYQRLDERRFDAEAAGKAFCYATERSKQQLH